MAPSRKQPTRSVIAAPYPTSGGSQQSSPAVSKPRSRASTSAGQSTPGGSSTFSPSIPTSAPAPTAEQQQLAPNPDLAADASTEASGKKTGRRAVKKRAVHNAIERDRRNRLNERFLDLAAKLPATASVRRPSKNLVVNKALQFVLDALAHEGLYRSMIQDLRRENAALRSEANEARAARGLPLLPLVDSVASSAQMPATLVEIGRASHNGSSRGPRTGASSAVTLPFADDDDDDERDYDGEGAEDDDEDDEDEDGGDGDHQASGGRPRGKLAQSSSSSSAAAALLLGSSTPRGFGSAEIHSRGPSEMGAASGLASLLTGSSTPHLTPAAHLSTPSMPTTNSMTPQFVPFHFDLGGPAALPPPPHSQAQMTPASTLSSPAPYASTPLMFGSGGGGAHTHMHSGGHGMHGGGAAAPSPGGMTGAYRGGSTSHDGSGRPSFGHPSAIGDVHGLFGLSGPADHHHQQQHYHHHHQQHHHHAAGPQPPPPAPAPGGLPHAAAATASSTTAHQPFRALGLDGQAFAEFGYCTGTAGGLGTRCDAATTAASGRRGDGGVDTAAPRCASGDWFVLAASLMDPQQQRGDAAASVQFAMPPKTASDSGRSSTTTMSVGSMESLIPDHLSESDGSSSAVLSPPPPPPAQVGGSGFMTDHGASPDFGAGALCASSSSFGGGDLCSSAAAEDPFTSMLMSMMHQQQQSALPSFHVKIEDDYQLPPSLFSGAALQPPPPAPAPAPAPLSA